MKKVLSLCLLINMGVWAFDHDHRLFDTILGETVSFNKKQSLVDYEALKKDHSKLQVYLKSLSQVSKKSFDQFSREEQLAFLINAYNAFTLKLIIDHYPLKSIKDIGNIFKGPWDQKFFVLLGEKRTLDQLEHKMIRPWFHEPRIHFAVNCASLGCPSLAQNAYTGKKLNVQLENALKHFLSNSSKNYSDPSKKRLYISKIFKWYKKDFKKSKKTLKGFLKPYFPLMTKDKGAVEKMSRYTIKWTDYDWNLNKK